MGRILVVDDQRNLRVTTALLLRAEGYVAREAESGEEALAILAFHEVDVMVTDLKMEPMDGLTLLQKALERVPQLQVIIMTAFGSAESAAEAMRIGACDYLSKPLTMAALLRAVARALELARARRPSSKSANGGGA